jgi:hypothetical protein
VPPERRTERGALDSDQVAMSFEIERPDHTQGALAHVMWCASGGAPIVGAPVVDENERTYVATADGYLHAFERDGRFRWSYTVKGTPLGSVSLRPGDGAILMGTTARYIYAIGQDGSLKFQYSTLTPVWSGLHALSPSTVVYLGHDSRLYALGNNGERKYRVKAPSDPMGGPVVADGDVVWVALVDGVAKFEAAFRLTRYPLPVAVEEVVVWGKGMVALGGGRAFSVSAEGVTSEISRARFVASDGISVVIIDEQGRPHLMDGDSNSVHLDWEEDIPPLSAAPTLIRDAMWSAHIDGTVRVHPRDGSRSRVVHVSNGALSSPVVSLSGKFALVPTPSGRFCAVELLSLSK